MTDFKQFFSTTAPTALSWRPRWHAPEHGSTVLPSEVPPRRLLQSRVRALDNVRHHGGERDPTEVLYLVYHATAGQSAMSSIVYLNTTSEKEASYHYVIDRDGTIYRMTPVHIVAWHAGDSSWPYPVYSPPGNGGHSLNHNSIGIAWANMDDGEELTAAQLESGLWLTTVFKQPVERILGHYEISPGRKIDPAPAINMNDFRDLVRRYRAQSPAV